MVPSVICGHGWNLKKLALKAGHLNDTGWEGYGWEGYVSVLFRGRQAGHVNFKAGLA